jgi:hypothetical protein
MESANEAVRTIRKGKRPTIVATAIAREPAAFVWAINREVMGNRQA